MIERFANDTIDVACPSCQRQSTLTIAHLEAEPVSRCSACGGELELDRRGIIEAVKDVDRAMNELKDAIERVNRHL